MTLSPPEIRKGDRVLYTPGGRVWLKVTAPPRRDGLYWLVACTGGVTLHLAPAARCEVDR